MKKRVIDTNDWKWMIDMNDLKLMNWKEETEINDLTCDLTCVNWHESLDEVKRGNWHEWLEIKEWEWMNWHMNELQRVTLNEWIYMKDLKRMHWHEGIEENELTWMHWKEWSDMKKLKWMNDLKRMNWKEWIGMNDLKGMMWHEWIDMKELRKVVGEPQFFTGFIWNRTLATVLCTFCQYFVDLIFKSGPNLSAFSDFMWSTTWSWCGWHMKSSSR